LRERRFPLRFPQPSVVAFSDNLVVEDATSFSLPPPWPSSSTFRYFPFVPLFSSPVFLYPFSISSKGLPTFFALLFEESRLHLSFVRLHSLRPSEKLSPVPLFLMFYSVTSSCVDLKDRPFPGSAPSAVFFFVGTNRSGRSLSAPLELVSAPRYSSSCSVSLKSPRKYFTPQDCVSPC